MDPHNPYAAPAPDLAEPKPGEALPGLRSLLQASSAFVCWFLLRNVLGWSGVGVAVVAFGGVVAVRGFALSLRGLTAEPAPRAGRVLVFIVLMLNGLGGALGGLYTLVSIAAMLGSCFDYAS
jgi:hypothetical protein